MEHVLEILDLGAGQQLFLIKIGVSKLRSEKSIYEYLKIISGVRLSDT